MGLELSPVKRSLGNELNNVIFRCDTASGILGISNLWLTDTYEVYSTKDFNIPELNVVVVDSLDDIPFVEVNGVKVTTELRTLQDMLLGASDGYPSQSLLESLSYFYETHSQSFAELEEELSASEIEVLNRVKQDAIEYYDE